MSPDTERTGPRQEAGPTITTENTISPGYDIGGWRAELAERIAQRQARREAERAQRAEQARRRAAGKRIGHVQRLRRGGGGRG